MLTEIDIEGAKVAAEKIREAVEKMRVPYRETNGQEDLKVTMSIGVDPEGMPPTVLTLGIPDFFKAMWELIMRSSGWWIR
ncbi:MAG: hypothetical protein ACLFRY_14920 [Spirochaetia bacterium]